MLSHKFSFFVWHSFFHLSYFFVNPLCVSELSNAVFIVLSVGYDFFLGSTFASYMHVEVNDSSSLLLCHRLITQSPFKMLEGDTQPQQTKTLPEEPINQVSSGIEH